jgi:hypothetical protein
MVHGIRRTFVTAAALLSLASPALAGPPLLCHPYDIGSARSLPWDGVSGWAAWRADYNVANLVSDTTSLLSPSTPVIVRMETLRRAAIYASRDPKVAAELLRTLSSRVTATDREARDPLAYLDAAYVTEAFREIGMMEQSAQFRESAPVLRGMVREGDGYALITKALKVRPDDPSLEFAAAVIAAGTKGTAYAQHAEKARAGVKQDPLLARNIGHVS